MDREEEPPDVQMESYGLVVEVVKVRALKDRTFLGRTMDQLFL